MKKTVQNPRLRKLNQKILINSKSKKRSKFHIFLLWPVIYFFILVICSFYLQNVDSVFRGLFSTQIFYIFLIGVYLYLLTFYLALIGFINFVLKRSNKNYLTPKIYILLGFVPIIIILIPEINIFAEILFAFYGRIIINIILLLGVFKK